MKKLPYIHLITVVFISCSKNRSACKFLYILILTLTALNGMGQEKAKSRQYTIGVSLSPVPSFVLSGTDTGFKTSLSFAPSFSMEGKKGFGITYIPRFVLGSMQGGIYMHDLTVAYQKYEKVLFDFYADYSHFFFTGNRSVPQSPITNEFYTQLSYKESWVRPLVAAGIGFGTTGPIRSLDFVYDLTLSAGISHSFYRSVKEGDVYFTPSIRLNAGTNEYFSFMNGSKYISGSKDFNKYVSKTIGKKGSGPAAAPGFSLNNLEIGVQPSYDRGPINVRLASSVYFPFSRSGAGVSTFWQLALQYEL